MARPYNALRRVMLSRSVTMTDIAQVFGCTMQTVSNKFRNVTPWTLDECWTVMHMLRLEPSKLSVYFPMKGRNE